MRIIKLIVDKRELKILYSLLNPQLLVSIPDVPEIEMPPDGGISDLKTFMAKCEWYPRHGKNGTPHCTWHRHLQVPS